MDPYSIEEFYFKKKNDLLLPFLVFIFCLLKSTNFYCSVEDQVHWVWIGIHVGSLGFCFILVY